MSDSNIEELRKKTHSILTLSRAPSQFSILFHLLETGRAMTIKEIASDVDKTPKAIERAAAKLLEKDLIHRSPFRNGAYTCDNRQILLALMVTLSEIYEDWRKKEEN